jgi:hypothetical protein
MGELAGQRLEGGEVSGIGLEDASFVFWLRSPSHECFLCIFDFDDDLRELATHEVHLQQLRPHHP